MTKTKQPAISVVIPLLNEELNVRKLYDAVRSSVTFAESDGGAEIIFVDDGSTDQTFNLLFELGQLDRDVKIIRFRQNFGQTAAMAAGIQAAAGQVIVTMDGDLQNDPRDIERLVDRIGKGADIVVGWRAKRKDKLLTRKIPSRIANWLIGKVTGVPIKDNGCSLKAYRSDVIKQVPLYSEMHRFIPAMSSITGATIEELQVRHHAREFGESKYGLSRIYKVLFDLVSIKMITAFSFRPLVWFGLLSLPFVAGLLIGLVWLAIRSFSVPDASIVVPSGVVLLCFNATVFMFLCGILGELVPRTSGQRPAALVALTAFGSPLNPKRTG